MSHWRTIVESVFKEYYDKYGRYTNDPQDEYDGEEEYLQWLENQNYKEGYAVFLRKDEKGHDVFATADKSVPNDPEYTPSTEIYGYDLELPDVFEYTSDKNEIDAKRKAEEFAQEWKQHFPQDNVEVVKVYSRNDDGYEFYRTKEEVYPFEDWDYSDYLADREATAAEMKWEADNER